MSPKAKKEAPKSTKAAKSAPAKAAPTKKGAKAALAAEAKAPVAAPAEGADEESDEDESAPAAGGGGNAAALAAATSSAGESASFKNFRHHPDMENFYRFIYENDLRLEALQIIEQMAVEKMTRKTVKAAKSQAH